MHGPYSIFKLFSQEMSQGTTAPRRVLHWLTTRPFQHAEEVSDFTSIVKTLEDNDWSGFDENGEEIIWDGLNMATCLRQDTNEWEEKPENCSHNEFIGFDKRQDLIAQDLNLLHVYFKETHIRKYTKEENFGKEEAIGN